MIPVVDLSDFVGGSTPQRRLVAEAVDRACVDIGFFTVVGHGVAADLVARVQREALAFFDLPVAERLAVAVPEPGYPYGYRPVEAEALSRSIGGDLTADLKESFNVGPIDAPPRPLDAMDDLDERAVCDELSAQQASNRQQTDNRARKKLVVLKKSLLL